MARNDQTLHSRMRVGRTVKNAVRRTLASALSVALLLSCMVFTPVTAQAAGGVDQYYIFHASKSVAENDAALPSNVTLGANVKADNRAKFVFGDGVLFTPEGARDIITYNLTGTASTAGNGDPEDPADHAGVPYRLYKATKTMYETDEDGNETGVTEVVTEYDKVIDENLKIEIAYVKDHPMDTTGMAAVNLSMIYAFTLTNNMNNVVFDDLMQVYVSLDGETWLEDTVGIRATELLGGNSLSKTEGFPGVFYRIETDNLLDIDGVNPGDTIKGIMIMPYGDNHNTFGRFAVSELAVNTYGTAADFDRLVPEDVRPTTYVEPATLRQIAVNEGVRTAQIEWYTDELVKTSHPGTTKTVVHKYYPIGHRGDGVQIVYHGPTYEREVDSTRELFQSQIDENGKWIGGLKLTGVLKDPESVFGMDCQTFVFNCISRVSRGYPWAVQNTIGGTGTTLVGDLVVEDHPAHHDKDVVALNSEQAIYESYALAQPGDITCGYDFDSGHTRLVKDVVVVRNEDGTIDGANSYIWYTEQASVPRYFYEKDGDVQSTQWYSSEEWEGKGYELLYGGSSRDNSRTTFQNLLSSDYLVFTMDEYKDGLVENVAVEAVVGSKEANQHFVDGGAGITISSNYRIISYRVELENKSTGENLYDSGLRYSMDSITVATNFSSSQLDSTLKALPKGDYRIKVIVDSGPFTTLAQDTVPQTVKNIDFTVEEDRKVVDELNEGEVFFIPGTTTAGSVATAYVVASEVHEVGKAVQLAIPVGTSKADGSRGTSRGYFWAVIDGKLTHQISVWATTSSWGAYKFAYHDTITTLTAATEEAPAKIKLAHAPGHTSNADLCAYGFDNACGQPSAANRYRECYHTQSLSDNLTIIDLRSNVLSGEAEAAANIAQVKALTGGNAVVNTYSANGASDSGTVDVVILLDASPDASYVPSYPVTVEQPTGGSVSVDKEAPVLGDVVTVTAKANTNYKLESILVDGVAIEGNTFTVTGLHTVTATFVFDGYTLQPGDVIYLIERLNSGAVKRGIIAKSDTVPVGTTVKFIAPNGDGSAYQNYRMARVTDSGTLSLHQLASATKHMAGLDYKLGWHEAITAIDTENGTFTLGDFSNGSHESKTTCPWCNAHENKYNSDGYIMGSYGAAACEGSLECAATQRYDENTAIVDLSGYNAKTLAMVKLLCDENKVMVDVYVPDGAKSTTGTASLIVVQPNDPKAAAPTSYKIAAGTVSGGTISVDKTEAVDGDTVTVTAAPEDGFGLKTIYVDGVAIKGNTFIVSGSHMVTAEFIESQIVTVGEVTNGTVTLEPNSGVPGTTVTVTATPNAGFALHQILVNGVAIEGSTFEITAEPQTVTATFLYQLQTGDVLYSTGKLRNGYVCYGYVAKSATVPSGTYVGFNVSGLSSSNNNKGFSAKNWVYVTSSGTLSMVTTAAVKETHTLVKTFALHEAITAINEQDGTFTMGKFGNGTHTKAATCGWNSGGPYKFDGTGYYYSSASSYGCESTSRECAATQHYNASTAIVDLSGHNCTTLSQIMKLTKQNKVMVDVYVPDGTDGASGTASLIVVLPINPDSIDYDVTVGETTNGTVTVEPATGKYGTVVTVAAAPAEGCELEAILVDGAAIEGNTFEIIGNHEVTATFNLITYDVTVGEVANGSVSVDVTNGVPGTTVTVTATPADGYVLESILVDGAAIEGNTFEITADHVVTASFKLVTYDVTVGEVTNGTVSVDVTNGAPGTTVTVTATPDAGYVLHQILVNGVAIEGNTFEITAEPQTVTAAFVYQLQAGDVLYLVEPLYKGNVKKAIIAKSATVAAGEIVSFVAPSGDGSVYWQYKVAYVKSDGTLSYASQATVGETNALYKKFAIHEAITAVDEDAKTFKMGKFSNGVHANRATCGWNNQGTYTFAGEGYYYGSGGSYGCESTSRECDSTQYYNDSTAIVDLSGHNCTTLTEVMALTKQNKVMVDVYVPDGAKGVSGTASLIVVLPINPTTIDFTITVDEAITGGTVTTDVEGGKYGQSVVITAAPEDGYVLESLTVDSVDVTGQVVDGQCTVTISGNTVITAVFASVQTDFTITVGEVVGGSVEVDKTIGQADEIVTVTAAAAEGYVFRGITVDGVVIEGNTFAITGNHVVNAVFTPKTQFAGTTVGMTEVLDLNFFFSQKTLEGITGAYVVMVGPANDSRNEASQQTIRVEQADWIASGETYYKVPYSGMTAKQMGEAVTVTVYDADGVALSDPYTSSIRDYAMRALAADSATDDVKTLAVDMLNYGAAAQVNFGYRTDDLANNALSAEQLALGTAQTKAYKDNAQKVLAYSGSTFNLENKIEMNMYFPKKEVTTTENTRVVIRFTHHDDEAETMLELDASALRITQNYAIMTITELVVADARQMVTCELYEGDTMIAKGVDSLESYVARATAASADNLWMEKILNFCDSAFAYLHNR